VFPKRLNHDKIAQECGSSKDTVARTAKRLKSSGKNPLDTRDRTLTMRGKKADPSIVSQIEAAIKLPNPLSLNIIASSKWSRQVLSGILVWTTSKSPHNAESTQLLKLSMPRRGKKTDPDIV
jgi:hypothetical protein